MSLGIVIKGPEGVVLAADSRVTLMAQLVNNPPIPVNFDNATKLLSFSQPNLYIGAVTFGAAVIGLRTAHSYIPEFELTLPSEQRLTVEDFSQRLRDFFRERWQETMPQDYAGPDMTFIVGGYDPEGAYGKVFVFDIPRQPDLRAQNPGEQEFGMTWGGQLQVASRLIHGYDPGLLDILHQRFTLDMDQITQLHEHLQQQLQLKIPYQMLPLQDCVELATFLIRTTIIAQGLAVEIRGVGGPIDVAVITRIEGLKYVQQKTIHGEKA
jgi:hypothetical protein